MAILKSNLQDIFHKILVIDIETVPLTKSYDDLSEIHKLQWQKKADILNKYHNEELNHESSFEEKAGIYAEFGKVVCIGIGYFATTNDATNLRIKKLANQDEKLLLQSFLEILQPFQDKYGGVVFCGHNIKEFDLPYLCRRLLVNGLELPLSLNLSGIKSWNHPHLDTLDMWRFGDYKHYVSLDLLATVFGVTSSKQEMDGSMVSNAYWNENKLAEISDYCARDVATTASVMLKMKGEDLDFDITYID